MNVSYYDLILKKIRKFFWELNSFLKLVKYGNLIEKLIFILG